MRDPHWKRSPIHSQPPRVVGKTLKYRLDQERFVRSLGSALVLHWDEVPDELQDLLIDQAVVVDGGAQKPHDREGVERFLRTVRAIPLKVSKATNPTRGEAP